MITRRDLIKDGGTATAALVVLGSDVVAAAPGVAAYLRRSTYVSLLGSTFTVAGHALKLAAVDDVAGPGLAGSEAAFELVFTGPAGLDQGTYPFRHAQLGRFELFLVPSAPGTYVVTVDRSVKIVGVQIPRGPRLKRLVRHARATRRPYGVARLDLRLRTDTVAEVLVELRGHGRTLRGTGEVADRHAAVLLRRAATAPRGAYDLTVTLVRTDRSRAVEQRRVRLG